MPQRVASSAVRAWRSILLVVSSSDDESLSLSLSLSSSSCHDRPSGPRMYERQRKYVGPGAALALMGKSKHF